MAKARKDNRGRVLRPGEVQKKSDNRYLYTYTDPLGRRKYIYASDLMELREREKKLTRDQLDGLNLYAAGKATINDTFDRYIKMKPNLRDSTRSNYIYMYNRFVRNDFGKKKLIDIKYSDILQYYLHLINDEKLAIATVANIHTLLHPTIFLPSSPAYLCEPALRGGEQSQGNPVHHGAQEHRDHNGYICGSDGSEEGRNL